MQRAMLVLGLLALTFAVPKIPANAAIDAIEGKWKQVFGSEFDGPEDLDKWTKQDSTGSNGNHELSAYVTDAFKVQDGCLHILAQKRDAKYGGKMMHYTSGLLNTKQKFEDTYARFDIRLKVPKGKGFCPAFWLLPSSGSWPPEIDMLEVLGSNPKRMYFTNHFAGDDKKHAKNELHFDAKKTDFSEGFHEVICVWSKGKIDYYVDAKKVASSNKGVPKEKMYMILNLAVGGDWPGSPDASTKFPNEMVVDYVRVYEVDESAEAGAKSSHAGKTPAGKPTPAPTGKK